MMHNQFEGSGPGGVLLPTAYETLIVTLVGLPVFFAGLTLQLKRSHPKQSQGMFAQMFAGLSLVIADKRSRRVFALSGVSYGVLFAFVSSIIVFRPGADFSILYGVSVPSVVPVVCCGSLGQMPQFVFYLTQQLAILLIPINLILLCAASWLVGLNSAIAIYAYSHRPSTANMGWIGGLGAFVGFFTACPTCAGFYLLSTVGLSGAATLAVALSSYQEVFAAIGIPTLLAAPLIALRKLGLDACQVPE
jgi:hypothetical protein